MKFISHRGNISGPNKQFENTPATILNAIERGYDVEVDVWYDLTSNAFYLGHDSPETEIHYSFLADNKTALWVHCKNQSAFVKLIDTDLNIFCHDTDMYAITSRGFVWAYPGNPPTSVDSVYVMPEYRIDIQTITPESFNGFFGVCSDYVDRISLCLGK